ncbi:ABC transporter permease (plasmid) [Agrobacterium pusense]|nr:ABC transporter permease [Agrobacterium pusense]QKJ94458.1 ABC transporter permease [Agrobacterium pusense]
MTVRNLTSKRAQKGLGQKNWEYVKTQTMNAAITACSILGGLLLWQIASSQISPLFLPSPIMTLEGLYELAEDGTLATSILASSQRILTGWFAGVVVGIPLGMTMGYFPVIRRLFDPYIEFFRFVPPIAFVTLAVIWLGPGESSKVALIFYTTVFIVTLNSLAGTLAVSELRIKASQALGASSMQSLLTVIVPSTIPYMITGARIAMGNSFLTIVSAEIVAAQEGLGALIWNARNFGRTEWVFAGIITLGLLGYVFDRVLRFIAVRALKRYSITM